MRKSPGTEPPYDYRHQTETDRPVNPDRPEIYIVMAMSADGKIATADRRIQTFGSSEDHDRLMRLRTTADAVMSGSSTVGTADYDLGPGDSHWRELRIQNGLTEYNLRIVVSGSGSLSPDAHLFQKDFSPVIVLTTDRCPDERREALLTKTPHVHSFGKTSIDWHRALKWLKSEWHINRLACEGGGDLNESLIRMGLADKLYITVTPLLAGGRSAPTIAGGEGVSKLTDASRYRLIRTDIRQMEIFLDYERV